MTEQSSAARERKYAMTRLGRGDYLLPSNDAQTLWRVYAYEEDGSATYQTEFIPGKGPSGPERVLRGRFWALARRPMPEMGFLVSDLFEWDDWQFWAGPLQSREQAIRYALSHEEDE